VKLVPSTIWYCPQDRFKEFREVTEASIFTPGIGLPGHVWNARGPVWIANAQDSQHFPRGASARASGLFAAFAFPLKAGEEVVAILEFFCETQEEPAPNTLIVIQTMGDQVGRVIERRQAESRALAEIERRKQVEKHQQLLLAELNHRVKNMLAVVTGIATQTARTNTSVAEFNESFVGRLQSLARGYDLLTASNWAPAALQTIATEVIAPHLADGAKQLAIRGPDVSVAPKAALALSMIFHELVTNATKYGALSVAGGKIEIDWRVSESNDVSLRWQEFGVPSNDRTADPGFGTRFIKASVRHELGGLVVSSLESSGMLYRFDFPLEESVET
jgi:two-component sensor histidine kinase